MDGLKLEDSGSSEVLLGRRSRTGRWLTEGSQGGRTERSRSVGTESHTRWDMPPSPPPASQ